MKRLFFRSMKVIWCIAMLLVVIVPLYICIINAFKPSAQSLRSYLSFPSLPTVEHFSFLIQEKHYLRHLTCSLHITSISALLCTIINSFIGFMIADNWDKKAYRCRGAFPQPQSSHRLLP